MRFSAGIRTGEPFASKPHRPSVRVSTCSFPPLKIKDPAEARSSGFGTEALLCRHLFGFAFLAHELQFALGRFDFGMDFLLDAGCRFLKLW